MYPANPGCVEVNHLYDYAWGPVATMIMVLSGNMKHAYVFSLDTACFHMRLIKW